jgi:hypothetical protein
MRQHEKCGDFDSDEPFCLLERLQCVLFSSFFSRNIQKRSIACRERGTPQTR